MNTVLLSTGKIVAPHEVRDAAKLSAISASMAANGWQGRPLLVVERADYYQALTGSHRYAAANAAALEELPCVLVDLENLEANGWEASELDGMDTEQLEGLFLDICDEDAGELMGEEVRAEVNG